MLMLDLTPDHADSGHISLPDHGNLILELQFNKPIPEAVTCLLYVEYNSVHIN